VFPLVLLLLCVLLFGWRLGVTPLEDFDEAYYAEGAREMLARGDLLTPYYNGQPFLLKPILVYWLIAAGFSGFGVTEFAARVGSAFLGTLVVLLTYWFGARTLGRRAGFLAGLVLALNYMWIDIARDASIDVPLTAALAPALFLAYLGMRAPPEKKRWLYLASYPLLGLALLAKGPAPTGVVLVGAAAFLLAAGRLRATLAEARVLPGIALVLIVAAPWYVYEAVREPDFLSIFLLREHFGHVHGDLARNEPFWGHLKNLLVYFLPWAAFLPAALIQAFRARDRAHVLRFAAWWLLAVVVLFSFAGAKLAHYLAPAFPAAALLVGAYLDAWLRRQEPGRLGHAIAFGLLAVVGLVCAVAAGLAAANPPWLQQRIQQDSGGWTPGAAPIVMLAALGAGFLGATAAARARTREAAVPLLAGAMLVAGFAHVGWFKPRVAEIQAQPRKELAQHASAGLLESEPLGVYYAKRNSTIFYARRPIVDLGERDDEFGGVVSFLSSPTPATVLTHAKFVPQLEELVPMLFLWTRRGDYVLLANHPVHLSAPWGSPRSGDARSDAEADLTAPARGAEPGYLR
jgi:4-amino-4-deoxy-L-arabinose transferase-like glycosyltransferase